MLAKIMENIETGQQISKKKEKYQKNKGKHIIYDIRQKKLQPQATYYVQLAVAYFIRMIFVGLLTKVSDLIPNGLNPKL